MLASFISLHFASQPPGADHLTPTHKSNMMFSLARVHSNETTCTWNHKTFHLKIRVFIFMVQECILCLHVSLCTVWRAGVRDGCLLPCRCWEVNLCLLQKQQEPVPAEPSARQHPFFFSRWLSQIFCNDNDKMRRLTRQDPYPAGNLQQNEEPEKQMMLIINLMRRLSTLQFLSFYVFRGLEYFSRWESPPANHH